jgi:hypothetical protein
MIRAMASEERRAEGFKERRPRVCQRKGRPIARASKERLTQWRGPSSREEEGREH